MLQQLARFLAPPCCLSCNYEGRLVCQNCWASVFHPMQTSCPEVSSVMAAGTYALVLRELIKRLKYNHQREAAQVIAQALLPILKPKRFNLDVVTAVPVSTSRLRQRGYNQAERIAKQLSRDLALPYCHLIVRLRSTRQVGKTRIQRLEHINGAFAAKSRCNGLRILIVDDVLTTGATLSECARVLKRAGASHIQGAVAARD